MYYKITDTESEIYKKLSELLRKEAEIDARNREYIKKLVELPYDKWFGTFGQTGFNRTATYQGFFFNDPSKVDPKKWVEKKGYPGCYVPNKRTNAGKMLHHELRNLPGSSYFTVAEILKYKMPYGTRFTVPQLFQNGDMVIMFCDERYRPTDPALIEVTRGDFEKLLEEYNNRKQSDNC